MHEYLDLNFYFQYLTQTIISQNETIGKRNKRYTQFQFVGNKAKGRMSKQVLRENKAGQIFRKTNISYPLIRTLACTYQEVRNVRFSENLACFVFL